MDADRFDILTRRLAAPASRRVALTGLTAGLLAVVAPSMARDETAAKKKRRKTKKSAAPGPASPSGANPAPPPPPPPPCARSCAGKVCGDDGCGGVCGNCRADQVCLSGGCFCASNADYCTNGASTCGTAGFCLRPQGGGPSRCGVQAAGDECGCANDAQCAGFGPGAFCALDTGGYCSNAFCDPGASFCAVPR